MGDKAVIGGAAAIQQFATIGSYAFIAGGSKVDGSVPSCMRAAGDRAALRGVNVVGLERNGFSLRRILETIKVVSQLWRPEDTTPSNSEDGAKHDQTTVRLVTPDAAALLSRAEGLLVDMLLLDSWTSEVDDANGVDDDSTTSIVPAALLLRSIVSTLACGSSSCGVESGIGGGSGRRRAPLCLWRNTVRECPSGVEGFDALQERITLLERMTLAREGFDALQDRITLLERLTLAREPRGAASALATTREAAGTAEGMTTDELLKTRYRQFQGGRKSSSSSPESLPDVANLKRLPVRKLKALLSARGLCTEGLKYKLVERLDKNRAVLLSADEGAAAHGHAREAAETDRSSMLDNLNPPLCPGHKEPCVVRVVKTQGPNFGRRYFACPRSTFPRARQLNPDDCGHFMWAHTQLSLSPSPRSTNGGVTEWADTVSDDRNTASYEKGKETAFSDHAGNEVIGEDSSLLREIVVKKKEKKKTSVGGKAMTTLYSKLSGY